LAASTLAMMAASRSLFSIMALFPPLAMAVRAHWSGNRLHVPTVSSLFLAFGIELLEISPQIIRLSFILNADKYHYCARNLRPRILDVV
jgi:hypothetical protein